MMIGFQFSQTFSPYQTNPLNYNPLRDLIKGMLDFDAIRACDHIKMFICATNVETGRSENFRA